MKNRLKSLVIRKVFRPLRTSERKLATNRIPNDFDYLMVEVFITKRPVN